MKKLVEKWIEKNRAKRLHNLIGKWEGQKTKLISDTEDDQVVRLNHKLEIDPNFSYNWTLCKAGLVELKNNYSKLVFQSQKALGLNPNWQIKKLTFNKLIILQHESDSTVVEHHFVKDFTYKH